MLSLFKSAKDTSNTRPLKLSAAISVIESALDGEVILTLTGSLIAGGDGGHAVVKYSRHMDVVPFLLGKWVDAIFNIEYRSSEWMRRLTPSSFDPSF